jgi:site-specific recombinase XerD
MGLSVGYFCFLKYDVVGMSRMEQEKNSLMEWINIRRPRSTVRNYESITKEFLEYSRNKGLTPKTDVAVASFMRYTVTDRPRKLSRTTVCQNIPSAISDHFRYTEGKRPTDSELIKQLKKSIERTVPKTVRDKLPVTMTMLQDFVASMELTKASIRDVFMAILMTFAMLRTSEVVQLRKEDIESDSDSLTLLIRRSKTDQSGEGAQVVISETRTCICPLKWYRIFCGVRNPHATFLFHRMGTSKDMDSPLSTATPNFVIKRLIKSIGLDPSLYGSHSCRKGGCTTAVEAGSDIRLIAKHGRWKSDAINVYIKDSKETKLSVTRKMDSNHKKKSSESSLANN